jgi:hypothetical protein
MAAALSIGELDQAGMTVSGIGLPASSLTMVNEDITAGDSRNSAETPRNVFLNADG